MTQLDVINGIKEIEKHFFDSSAPKIAEEFISLSIEYTPRKDTKDTDFIVAFKNIASDFISTKINTSDKKPIRGAIYLEHKITKEDS